MASGHRLGALVELLAEAILADHGRDGVGATVIEVDRHPANIAAVASGRRTGGGREPDVRGFAAWAPELSYTDWRDEMFCLLTPPA